MYSIRREITYNEDGTIHADNVHIIKGEVENAGRGWVIYECPASEFNEMKKVINNYNLGKVG